MTVGCSGYRVGVKSLYAPDVRTVFVPIVESASFRRNLGERLTEALVREIELKTPYRIVDSPQADSVLNVTLTGDTKRVTIDSRTDEPREIDINFQVRVAWVSRQGDILAQQSLDLPPDLAVTEVGQSTFLYPEAGQTVVTAQQKIIQSLAEQIVGLMEAPW